MEVVIEDPSPRLLAKLPDKVEELGGSTRRKMPKQESRHGGGADLGQLILHGIGAAGSLTTVIKFIQGVAQKEGTSFTLRAEDGKRIKIKGPDSEAVTDVIEALRSGD